MFLFIHYFHYSFYNLNNPIIILSTSILIAAFAKSTKVPFSGWIVDAMAAPTPVSALLHSATMVTAGIFLIFKLFFLSSTLLICSIGCFTSLFGSIMAMFQSHMKRIIAYSTTSQLGYMMFSCALGNYYGAMFHLFIHAFFKSLLFLTAGHILHLCINESHIIKLSGFYNVLPLSYNFILIGSLCLIGWPNVSGYYSKEYIINYSYYLWSDLFLYYISIFAIHCTIYYSSKIIYMQFSIVYNIIFSTHHIILLSIIAMIIGNIFDIDYF